MSPNGTSQPPSAPGRIRASDLLALAQRNGLLITLVSLLLLSLLLGTAFLLHPKPYQRRITFSIDLTCPGLSSFPYDPAEARTHLLNSFKELNRQDLLVDPRIDATGTEITVLVRSVGEAELSAATPELTKHIESVLQKLLLRAGRRAAPSIRFRLERQRQILAGLPTASREARPPALALDLVRASYLAAIAVLDYDRAYLQQVQADPKAFQQAVAAVHLESQSEIRQNPPLAASVTMAVLASLVLATLLAAAKERRRSL